MTTEFRTGIGWDSHRLVPGRPLILGGIRIDSPVGLLGHSDADVLAHAITDALLGAAGLGDIGMHFPDTDPQWENVDSLQILHHAVQLVHMRGNRIMNIDATVILEKPKLKDYRVAIRESIARTIGITVDRVSVKFKTAEGLGPVGEGRAAEAQAIATIAVVLG